MSDDFRRLLDVGIDDLGIADDLVGHWVFNSLEVLVDDVLHLVRVDECELLVRHLDFACLGILEQSEGSALSDLTNTSLSDNRARSVGGAKDIKLISEMKKCLTQGW